MHNRGSKIDKNAFLYAAGNGHLDILKWLLQCTQVQRNTDVSLAAVEQGNLNILKWLRSVAVPIDYKEAIQAAVENGNLEMLQWIVQKKQGWLNDEILDTARRMMYAHIVEWMVSLDPLKYPLTTITLEPEEEPTTKQKKGKKVE